MQGGALEFINMLYNAHSPRMLAYWDTIIGQNNWTQVCRHDLRTWMAPPKEGFHVKPNFIFFPTCIFPSNEDDHSNSFPGFFYSFWVINVTFIQVNYPRTNDLVGTLLGNIISLLQEYDDVFPKQTSHRLFPICGIEYHINFVLGVTVPNRPAYIAVWRRWKRFKGMLMNWWRRDTWEKVWATCYCGYTCA